MQRTLLAGAFAALLLVPLPLALAAEKQHYEFVPSMNCRYVRTGHGVDGAPIYATYCSNARWTPAFVDARSIDVFVQQPGEARTYYGQKICPDTKWLEKKTQEIRCEYPTEPGSGDPGIIVAHLVVTGPSARFETGPADGAKVQDVITYTGRATDPKGIDRVEWRLGASSGSVWRPLAGAGTDVPWTLTFDTTKMIREGHTVYVRATAFDGIVSETSRMFVVDNPAWVDHRITSVDHDPWPFGTPQFDIWFSTSGNVASVGYHIVGEGYRNGAWETFFDKRVTNLGGTGLRETARWSGLPLTEYGSFPVRFTIDPENKVEERDETNNVHTTRIWNWLDVEEQGDLRDLASDPHVPR